MNVDRDLDVNPNALDVECLNLPQTHFRYNEKLADAKMDLARAKENHDITKAEKDNAIRTRPKKYGIRDKLTEGAIRAVIAKDKKCSEALEEVNRCNYEVDILSAAVKALDVKKVSVEGLIKLHGQNYFSSPKLPRDIDQEIIKDRKRKEALGITDEKLSKKKIKTKKKKVRKN